MNTRNSDLITQQGGFTASSSRMKSSQKEKIGHDISPLDKELSATDSCWDWESQFSLKL